MVTRDLAIKYRNLYQELEMMLTNISEAGFDVKEYQNKLTSIANGVNDNIKNKKISNFAKAGYEIYYSEGINLLNTLKNSLDRYDVYYRVLNSCNLIDIKIQDKVIDSDELKKCIAEMIFNLKQLSKSDTVDYDNEKHIVDKICETTYNLIKLEVLKTRDSQLYSFCKNEDVNVAYFDKLIRNEIKDIDLSDDKYIPLRMKLFEIKSKGIGSNYFNLDVIKCLLVGNDNIDGILNEEMNGILDELGVTSKQINEHNLNDSELTANSHKLYIKHDKKKIRMRIIAIIGAIITIVSLGTVPKKVAKRSSYQDKYSKTTEIYSSIDESESEKKEEVFWSSNSIKPRDSITIKEYHEYENDKKRKYEAYDVSGYEFDSLKDYYDYGTNNYEVAPINETARSIYGDDISNYHGDYTTVEKITYEYMGKDYNKADYDDSLIIYWLVYMGLLVIVDVVYIGATYGDPFIIYNLLSLISEVKELKKDKAKYSSVSSYIKKDVEILTQEINKYEELRNKFKELYENNKYLLAEENRKELMEKLDAALCDSKVDDVKTLVKKYKGK